MLFGHELMGFAPAPDGGGSPLVGFIPFLLIIVIIYFLILRPEQKRQRLHREMLQRLRKGDEVVTMGGLFGRIVGLNEDRVILKIAENIRVEVERNKIARVVREQSPPKE